MDPKPNPTAQPQIFVSDPKLNTIQRWTVDGQYLSSFGSAGSGNGQFNYPFGITVEPPTGNVYIADTNNNRIQVRRPGPRGNGEFKQRGAAAGRCAASLIFVVQPTLLGVSRGRDLLTYMCTST